MININVTLGQILSFGKSQHFKELCEAKCIKPIVLLYNLIQNVLVNHYFLCITIKSPGHREKNAVWEHKPRCKKNMRDQQHLSDLPRSPKWIGYRVKLLTGGSKGQSPQKFLAIFKAQNQLSRPHFFLRIYFYIIILFFLPSSQSPSSWLLVCIYILKTCGNPKLWVFRTGLNRTKTCLGLGTFFRIFLG